MADQWGSAEIWEEIASIAVSIGGSESGPSPAILGTCFGRPASKAKFGSAKPLPRKLVVGLELARRGSEPRDSP
jgi:hypothetical protein